MRTPTTYRTAAVPSTPAGSAPPSYDSSGLPLRVRVGRAGGVPWVGCRTPGRGMVGCCVFASLPAGVRGSPDPGRVPQYSSLAVFPVVGHGLPVFARSRSPRSHQPSSGGHGLHSATTNSANPTVAHCCRNLSEPHTWYPRRSGYSACLSKLSYRRLKPWAVTDLRSSQYGQVRNASLSISDHSGLQSELAYVQTCVSASLPNARRLSAERRQADTFRVCSSHSIRGFDMLDGKFMLSWCWPEPLRIVLSFLLLTEEKLHRAQ